MPNIDGNDELTKPIRKEYLIIGILAGALGWFIATFVLARLQRDKSAEMAIELAFEFFKTFVVAAFIAFILDRYLRSVLGEGKAGRVLRAGLGDVYPSRKEAVADIRCSLNDALAVDIMGISLRDYLGPERVLSDVWREIEETLVHEAKERVPSDKRLKVRLLMLHPRSSEGWFRFKFEQSSEGGGLANLIRDVNTGLAEVQRVQAEIYRAAHGDEATLDKDGMKYVRAFLDVKLYDHCPFCGLFLTEKQAFVEQYYYKNQGRHIDVPLLCYSRKAIQDEFRASFTQAWKHSRPAVLREEDVRTAGAIASCGITNIFSSEQRNQSGDRQFQVLSEVTDGKQSSQIRILAISGKYYTSPKMMSQLISASRNGIAVKFLLLNPLCAQAVLRAVADKYPGRITPELRQWNWQRHQESSLYGETKGAILDLDRRINSGLNFQLRLHHSSPSCSLFLTNEQAFVEQYVYGRSRKRTENEVLGGEYPVFEFGRKEDSSNADTLEMELLSSTFDIIWKSYSIDVKDYLKLNEEEEFGRTMAELARWNALIVESQCS